ncbi:MAG: hypothetical protein H7061_02875 [Bdellovibrionaceae bacterium]|nr:hypothetical protein [Bdellovibrio sp.]
MDTPVTSEVSQAVSVDTSRNSGSSAFSHSEQRISQDLSLKQISQIFLNNWLLFILLFSVLSAAAVAIYALKVPYLGQATIAVNDTQNSSLQSFASQYFGLTKSVSEGKKNNSPLLKNSEYLKTTEFFEKLLTDIQARGESGTLSIAEKQGYEQFKNAYLGAPNDTETKLKTLSMLDGMSKTKLASDYDLKVAFTAPTREMATFLTNTALQTTLATLKQKELTDIVKIEKFIGEQRAIAEKNMNDYNHQLAEFQNKPENLISLSSKEKVGEYLSELMVRKNELKMKISENQKIIAYLSQGRGDHRESQLYGNGGRIEALKLENQMHQNQLANIQSSVDRVTSMAKAIPVAGQIFEDLKRKSDIEFQKYKSLTEAAGKAEGQKLSIESRFEALETARYEKVGPQISLAMLLLISFVLSQVLGSLMIYVNFIWDYNTVTAQASRNVVILDGHSIDPRVIIENSKIRFRLRDTGFDENSSDLDDSHKRLTFRIFNKKSANGED